MATARTIIIKINTPKYGYTIHRIEYESTQADVLHMSTNAHMSATSLNITDTYTCIHLNNEEKNLQTKNKQ